jgi:hypothetical protein
MRAMVLRQMTRTKSRAGPTFSCDAGNEGNVFLDVIKNI